MEFFKNYHLYQEFKTYLSYKDLIIHNATQEIKLRYNKSVIGPLWNSLSMSIFVISFGIIGSKLWGMNISEFLPTFAAGYIIWVLISNIISDATNLLSGYSAILKSIKIPISIFMISMVLKNIIIFFFHLLVFLIICIFLSYDINFYFLLFLPSLLLLSLIGFFFSFIWSILCARFNDLAQFTTNILQIFFFITPIFWPAERLTGVYFKILVDLNPIYQILNLIKQPLLGNFIDLNNLFFSLALIFILIIISLFVGNKFRNKIIFFI